jgi:aarF domain-containing kinase
MVFRTLPRLRLGLKPPSSLTTTRAARPRFVSSLSSKPSPALHPSFFIHAPPRIALRRYALCLIPVVGGIGLYLTSWDKKAPLSSLLTSPDLIPCPAPTTVGEETTLILSPNEPQIFIPGRIVLVLRAWIWEPLLTARRFVYLAFIFAPVILSAPMLLVGVPSTDYGGDKWGAVWWYDFLVAQMARAGPTFIKVRPH